MKVEPEQQVGADRMALESVHHHWGAMMGPGWVTMRLAQSMGYLTDGLIEYRSG